jgi:lipid-binding SYLF domain-containing protein
MNHPVVKITAIVSAFTLSATISLAAETDKVTRKVEAATEVYRELLQAPDSELPEELLEKCNCIGVIPHVVKAALGWGGRRGRGVLSCRNDDGEWSPPLFVNISGGSFGLQIGGQASDVVLFFMTERSIKALLKSKFTIGGEASVAAGPFGRTAEVSTDATLNAEIYSYARSRGLFAGLSLEGARLAANQKLIKEFYGQRIFPDRIVLEHKVPNLPKAAQAFMDALP